MFPGYCGLFFSETAQPRMPANVGRASARHLHLAFPGHLESTSQGSDLCVSFTSIRANFDSNEDAGNNTMFREFDVMLLQVGRVLTRQWVLALTAAMLAVAAGSAAAQGGGAGFKPIDGDGSLNDAELLERANLLLMADRTPPMPAAQGAISAAVGQVGFSLVSGGLGAGVDLVQPADEGVHPSSPDPRKSHIED